MVFCLGYSLAMTHNHKAYNQHYTKQSIIEIVKYDTLVIRIREIQKPTWSNRYIVDIEQYNSKTSFGKLMMYTPLEISFNVDDRLLTIVDFRAIDKPRNPYQFNYHNYLKHRNVYASISLTDTNFKRLSSANTIYGYADKVRQYVMELMCPWDINHTAMSIFEALVLGQRQDISDDLKDSFERAGVVHILAISGLHIGIILLFLRWLFRPLHRLPKGRIISTFFMVLMLWGFAIVSGLSPSVIRAVGMFTLVALSLSLRRRAKLINTILAAAFLSLLIDPNMLFEVGFQLSYAAVLSIAILAPWLQSMWCAKHKLLIWFRDTISVTLAAQIGVLPISLFYFHQFPGLFLVANIVLIPLVTFILFFSFVMVLFATIKFYHFKIALTYEWCIELMTGWVSRIAQFDYFFTDRISFGWLELCISYGFLFLFGWLHTKPTAKRIQVILITISGLLVVSIYSKLQLRPSELIIFHKTRHTIIGINNGQRITLYHDMNPDDIIDERLVSDYETGSGIKTIKPLPKQNLFEFNGKLWLVLDSMGINGAQNFEVNGMVITQSPRIHLDRWLDSLQPKIVIADGSNYKSFLDRWEASCRQKGVEFHRTDTQGAYIEIIKP